jgi:hypothetical protein
MAPISLMVLYQLFLTDTLDRPDVRGTHTPSWEHILYTQPYNQHIKSKRRLTWESFRNVLFEEDE